MHNLCSLPRNGDISHLVDMTNAEYYSFWVNIYITTKIKKRPLDSSR